jgi:hypothetical protein
MDENAREYNGGTTLALLLDGKSADLSAEVFKNVSWAGLLGRIEISNLWPRH